MSVVERLERAARSLRDEAELGTDLARTKADALALEGELKETNRAIGARIVQEYRRVRTDAPSPETVALDAATRNLVEEALRLEARVEEKERHIRELMERSQLRRMARGEGAGAGGPPTTGP